MCSTLIMPADYEMLVSHSPPVFSHSPPSASFLTDYNPYRIHLQPRNTWHSTLAPPQPPTKSLFTPLTAGPKRPCLVLRTDVSTDFGSDDPLSPTRLKKRVVFADDRGMSLTEVRVMSEPSSVPPLWTSKFLAQVTKGLTAEATPEPWEVKFPQPASNYVDFRRRLDQENVSLENVIVRETEESVLGTIKVRNLSFHKEVIVRSSSDNWATHEDTFCKFVNNSAIQPGTYVLYDTFSFRLILPPRSRRIEFCVCFRCDDKEYWDNNSNRNYALVKKEPELPPKANIIENERCVANFVEQIKCSDALRAKVEAWSEFASWNHLENDIPYW